MIYKNYPDGSGYWKMNRFPEQVTFKLEHYGKLWELNQLCDVYNYNNKPLNITIPWLIDGQADRRFNENESTGLKLILKALNRMLSDYNNISISIFHPHNQEVVESVLDEVNIIDNSNYLSQVLTSIYSSWPDADLMFERDIIILTPDAGMYKYIGKVYDKINCTEPLLSASKIRTNVEGKSKLKHQLPDYDFEKQYVLIVDDLSIRGGTFKGLSKLLKDRNVGKLYLAVSHMTIQDLGGDPVTNYFDKVFTTNSCHDNYFAEADGHDRHFPTQPNNLEIIKLF